MDTIDCILTRRSIRKFKNLPVEWYKVGKVIECGAAAPTAGNLQDFRFMVISDPGLKTAIAMAALEQQWIANAPVLLIVLSEHVKTKRFYGIRGERLYTIQDSAAAAQNILLSAHELGLAACWVGAFDEDKVNSLCNVPDYARAQAIIPLGYADEEVPVPAKYKLENFVFFNRWGDNAGKALSISEEMLKDWSPKVERAIKKVQSAGAAAGDKATGKIRRFFQDLRKK